MSPEPARTAWLAFGVVLTTATQLRPGNLPLGIGEMLLALWMLDALLRSVQSGSDEFVRDGFAIRAGLFWMVSACLLAAGALLSLGSKFTAETGAMHDAAALTFSAAASIIVALRLQASNQARAFSAALVITTVAFGIALLLAALTVGELGPVKPWYGGIRFAGWATNPNQMALLVVACPFLALQLASDAASGRARALWFVASGAAAITGLATLSDALAVAWGLCLALCAGYVWKRGLERHDEPSWQTLLSGVLIPLTAAFALIPALHAVQGVEDGLAAIYREGNQGSLRFLIWSHGLESLTQSPVFGWGPGAHAGIAAPHQGYEAHNTFIDWATASGLVGLAAYLCLLSTVIARALVAQRLGLVLSALSLVLFSAFHYVLRQPIFWMYLLVIYEYSRACERRPLVRMGASACVV